MTSRQTFHASLVEHGLFVPPESLEGWARVSTEDPTAETAAAVATVKLCGGWDESDPIVIEFERGAFAARFPPCEVGFWKVEVDDLSVV